MSLRRRDRDSIAQMRGGAVFFYKLAMFILFPLRKPLIFFPLLLILFMAPTFNGVKPAEVHRWYWGKIKQYTLAVTDFVSEKTKKVLPKDFKIKVPSIGGNSASEIKGTDKLVEYPTVDVNANRRAMFERASSAPVMPVDIVTDESFTEDESTLGEPATEEKEIIAPLEKRQPAEELQEIKVQSVKRHLPLVYLDTPKEVIGTVTVHNANELEVDGIYIFLYGIYVNPDTEQGIYAKKFLENMVKNQIVRCSIVAYTLQDVATGMCYLNGENINKMMVTNNFSKNVAL